MLSRNRSAFAAVRGRRSLAAALLAAAGLIVTACSTNNVLSLRPDVDIAETSALPVIEPVAPDYASADTGDADPSQSDPYLGEASQPDAAADPYIAADPSTDAESDPYQSQGQSDVYQAAYPRAADPIGAPGPYVEPVDPDAVQSEPDVDSSGPYVEEPEPFIQQPEPMSRDEITCRQQLKRFDVSFEELDPINEGGACQIDHPIKLKSIGRVKMQPAATLRCEMALAVATWTKRELVPSARKRYFTGVKTIHQASSYSCRKIARSRTMSEHAKGNALDISRIELNNGRDIEVEKQGIFAFRSKGLLNNVRADACEYFSTVLGPGYNYDHRNHFHFDIKPRRRGACH